MHNVAARLVVLISGLTLLFFPAHAGAVGIFQEETVAAGRLDRANASRLDGGNHAFGVEVVDADTEMIEPARLCALLNAQHSAARQIKPMRILPLQNARGLEAK